MSNDLRERALAWATSVYRDQDARLVAGVGYVNGAREEALRAANKLRAATDGTRTWFNERLMKLADEIEEGR